MKQIQSKFKLKDDKIEDPKNYLGDGLSKILNQDGDEFWAMSSEYYCDAVVANVEEILRKKGM